MRVAFAFAGMVMLVASSAVAAEPQKPVPPSTSPTVDFSVVVKNPLGRTFDTCPDKTNPDCGKPATLGFMAYTALSAAPRDARGQVEPGNPMDAALGWRVLASTGPVHMTASEKARIVAALRRTFDPGSAYAACRLVVEPDDCDKQ